MIIRRDQRLPIHTARPKGLEGRYRAAARGRPRPAKANQDRAERPVPKPKVALRSSAPTATVLLLRCQCAFPSPRPAELSTSQPPWSSKNSVRITSSSYCPERSVPVHWLFFWNAAIGHHRLCHFRLQFSPSCVGFCC